MRALILLSVALPVAALAQSETVGPPRGKNAGNYNIVQSWEFGYRLADIGGNREKYRSDVNYRNGFRLLNSSLSVNSREGKGQWLDELLLTTQGLGNDPYESATVRVQKNKLYRYDLLWRQNDYFSPGLTVSGGLHLEDTSHRWQDHDLTLLPQNWFRVRLGYSRVQQDGPALTTEQLFTARDPAYPVSRKIRQQFDDYRLGGDVVFRGFRFTLQRRWEFFKEDSHDDFRSPFVGVFPGPPPGTSALLDFHRSEPYRGMTPSWLGNLYGEMNWISVNTRITYSGGRGRFAQNEMASGTSTFGGARRLILVSGDADRPVVSGDFNFTLFPSSRFSLINNTSASNVRMAGTNNFTQYDLDAFSFASLNFQALNIRLVTNATDARYRFSKQLDAFGGFRYSDRQIRSVEAQASPGFPDDAIRAEQTNVTRAGLAGFNWLPMRNVRAHLEGEIGRNDNPFTPVSLRNYHSLRGKLRYQARAVSTGISYQDSNNQNSTTLLSYSSRSRSSFGDFSWIARSWLSIDTSYSKMHLDSIGGIAFFSGAPRAQLVANQKSIYTSNIHSLNFGFRIAAGPHADLYAAYGLTKDTGDGRSATTVDPFYNAQAFPLTYHTPSARLSWRLHEKLRFNLGYRYYGYREKFGQLLVQENYRAHTGYTSLLWSF